MNEVQLIVMFPAEVLLVPVDVSFSNVNVTVSPWRVLRLPLTLSLSDQVYS